MCSIQKLQNKKLYRNMRQQSCWWLIDFGNGSIIKNQKLLHCAKHLGMHFISLFTTLANIKSFYDQNNFLFNLFNDRIN